MVVFTSAWSSGPLKPRSLQTDAARRATSVAGGAIIAVIQRPRRCGRRCAWRQSSGFAGAGSGELHQRRMPRRAGRGAGGAAGRRRRVRAAAAGHPGAAAASRAPRAALPAHGCALLASVHSDPPLQPRAGPCGAVSSALSFVSGGVLVALVDELPARLRRDLESAMASPDLQPTGGATAVCIPRSALGAAVWALASEPQPQAAHARAVAGTMDEAPFAVTIPHSRRSCATDILRGAVADAAGEKAAVAALPQRRCGNTVSCR